MACSRFQTVTSRYATVLDREIHFLHFEPTPEAKAKAELPGPPVVMWHGLARTSGDFRDIAHVLASPPYCRTVYAPDTIGRGYSQWSPEPDKEYAVPFYCALATALVNDVWCLPAQFDWLGTSMGGIIGFCVSGTGGPLRGRVRRLLLNDIGPRLNSGAVERILAYAGGPLKEFSTLTALEAYFRKVYAPFGPQTDEWFRAMTQRQSRRLPNGNVTTHYDPKITVNLKPTAPPTVSEETLDDSNGGKKTVRVVTDTDPVVQIAWACFDGLAVEALLMVRGGVSDVLDADGAADMLAHAEKLVHRHGVPEGAPDAPTKARLVEVPGVGHCPVFTNSEEQRLVTDLFGPADAGSLWQLQA